MYYKDLINAGIRSNEAFVDNFQKWLRRNGFSISTFCFESQISESTMYKILSNPKKDFRISTFRQILKAVKKLDGHQIEGATVAIITTRGTLDELSRKVNIQGKELRVKEYPATTIEEEIIRGIHAEHEGVKGIICGPVAAATLEKVVSIPVIGLRYEERLVMDALRNIAKKIE
jgi:predicted transcriptional regulator